MRKGLIVTAVLVSTLTASVYAQEYGIGGYFSEEPAAALKATPATNDVVAIASAESAINKVEDYITQNNIDCFVLDVSQLFEDSSAPHFIITAGNSAGNPLTFIVAPNGAVRGPFIIR